MGGIASAFTIASFFGVLPQHPQHQIHTRVTSYTSICPQRISKNLALPPVIVELENDDGK